MAPPPQGGGGGSPPNGRGPFRKAGRWIVSILGKAGRWIVSILGKFLIEALLIGVGAGIILAFMAPVISENIAYVNPTCDQPLGVQVIPSTDIEAHGPTYVDEDDDDYPPDFVLDGDPGSMWAPLQVPVPEEEEAEERLAVFSEEEADRRLTLEFAGEEERDVALVCVVNGLAIEPWRYRNFGRVKNIAAWPDGSSTRQESTLKTLDDGEMQNLQQVEIDAGPMRSIHLAPIDAYHGEIVESFDPDVCETRGIYEYLERDPNGCVIRPTRNAGLAEVIVFEVDPEAPGLLERLWSTFF